MSIELVATAHPTEITRQNVLDKHILVNGCLAGAGGVALARASAARRSTACSRRSPILWQTDAMRAERPRVIDEVRRVLFFFDHILVDAAGAVQEELERLLAEPTPAVRPPRAAPRLRLVGGRRPGRQPQLHPGPDRPGPRPPSRRRDPPPARAGHPAGRRAGDLGAHGRRQRRAARLDRGRRGDDAASPRRRSSPATPAEPYRRKLSYVWERLDPEGEAPYADPDEMLADLRVVEASLREHRGERIARRGLARLLRQVETFGFHMARLDVRQHSRRLREAADGARRRAARGAARPRAAEVLETFRELRRAIDVHGPRAAGHADRELHPRGRGPARAAGARARHRPGPRGGRATPLGRRPRAPLRDHRATCAGAPGDAPRPPRRAGVPAQRRGARRPPDRDGRLLRLEQGRRLPGGQLGAVPGAGAHRRRLPPRTGWS